MREGGREVEPVCEHLLRDYGCGFSFLFLFWRSFFSVSILLSLGAGGGGGRWGFQVAHLVGAYRLLSWRTDEHGLGERKIILRIGSGVFTGGGGSCTGFFWGLLYPPRSCLDLLIRKGF